MSVTRINHFEAKSGMASDLREFLERISVGLKGLDFFVNATIALIKGGAHGTINQR